MKYIKMKNITILIKSILLAIFVIFFTSCAGMKSVRSKNSFSNNSRAKIEEKIDFVNQTNEKNAAVTMKEENSNYSNYLNNLNNNDEKEIVNNIPTITEQINRLIESNQSISEDIKNIKSKINDLEKKI